jgi:hypothetical protein
MKLFNSPRIPQCWETVDAGWMKDCIGARHPDAELSGIQLLTRNAMRPLDVAQVGSGLRGLAALHSALPPSLSAWRQGRPWLPWRNESLANGLAW